MLVVIDGPMIDRFIDDVDSFNKCADDRFSELDADGILLRDDLRRGISLPMEDLFFDKIDADRSGSIDKERFRSMMAEMLMVVARGLGPAPVIFGVDPDSLMMKAYESDVARIERRLADGKLKNKASEIESMKKDLKKKRSKKIFGIGMCACSPKYMGED